MVLVFNLQKAEIPIYMPFTSKGVPFEDQNYFINRISHRGVAQHACAAVAIATLTQI